MNPNLKDFPKSLLNMPTWAKDFERGLQELRTSYLENFKYDTRLDKELSAIINSIFREILGEN